MTPRFYFHPQADEPQQTFIAMPAAPTGVSFGGWGPKI